MGECVSKELEISVVLGKELSETVKNELFELFDESYAQANHAYLMSSFKVMRWIALARDNGKLAGFAVADAVKVALPRFTEPQLVAMAGISCIGKNYRRGGLFGQLTIAAMAESEEWSNDQPFLFCGRMAHSVSYRAMADSANNAVPAANQKLTTWHSEMLLQLAKLYDVEVDPKTSRVIGKGVPIGYPRLEYESTIEEVLLFESIERDKGDSLLAMSWVPEAPVGWLC